MSSKRGTFKYLASKKYDSMMGRCYRERDPGYKSYGARGIKMCSSWLADINNFRSWFTRQLVLSGISEEHFVKNSRSVQLDRIDPDGHYSPENCRLVSPQQNTRNRGGVVRKIISSEGDEFFIGGPNSD